MNLTDRLLDFTLMGAEWVLWLLIGLSIASIAVIIERVFFYHRRLLDAETFASDLRRALEKGDFKRFKKKYDHSPAMAARVSLRGLEERERGVDAVAEAMNSEKANAKQAHEQNLVFLGTLGNNAPFIGLFGTVLGVIQAFHVLQENQSGGIDLVMGAVAEALIATAVGLFVAIPAVIAFNVFNRRVRAAVNVTDSVAHIILGAFHGPAEKRPTDRDDDEKEGD